MKILAIAVWFLFASFGSATAANLVINGDFSTGTLAPWIIDGNATAENDGDGGFVCRMDASNAPVNISQPIATQAATLYYVSLKATYAGQTSPFMTRLDISLESNATPYASKFYALSPGASQHFGFTFTATGTSTLRIQTDGNITFIDDVSVIPLPVSPLAGKYRGTSKLHITAGLPGFETELLTKRTEPVSARVYPTGEFILIRNNEHVGGGIFLPEPVGAFRLRINRVSYSGTAQIRGRTIKLSFAPPTDNKDFIDAGGNLINRSILNEMTLTRAGK